MLDYLTALTMLLLVFGHALLIHKCTKLTDEIEPSAGKLSTDLNEIHSLIDELLDIVHEATNSLIPKAAETAQTGVGMMDLLSAFLKPNNPIGHIDSDGYTKQEDWEILPKEDDKTTQTEHMAHKMHRGKHTGRKTLTHAEAASSDETNKSC